jgi:uncharacterized protein (DUF427 family)
VNNYPEVVIPPSHVEPAPRWIRAQLDGQIVVDSTRAVYVWEWAYYPQYYIPLSDVRPGLLVPEGYSQHSPRGQVEVHSVRAAAGDRKRAARVLVDSPVAGLSGTVRFEWAALDAWFEEDEQIFVHPRNPYVRVDALQSTRHVLVELDGVVLAESSAPVLVFETGLPTRYYLHRTQVNFEHLIPTDTVTACPYKGTTSGYWSVRTGESVHPDLAWAYDFPTRQLLPIAGMIAFYNEKVDISVNGQRLERPQTHFSRATERDSA